MKVYYPLEEFHAVYKTTHSDICENMLYHPIEESRAVYKPMHQNTAKMLVTFENGFDHLPTFF